MGVLAAVLGLVLLGVPIAYCLLSVALVYIILYVPFGFISTPEKIFDSGAAPSLVALLLFLLLAEIATEAGLARRITDFFSSLVGHWRGGVGHVSVLSNAGMAGISGSEAADIAALGRLFVPAMDRMGYGRAYATSLVSVAAIMGPIIPPSIPMVIFGSLAGVSIGKLFLGGVVPGLLLGLSIMLTHGVIARRRNHPALPRASFGTVAKNTFAVAPISVLPVVIIGGIVSGKFTATEAGSIAVAVAIVLGLVYRGLTIRGFGRALARFVETLGPLMFIVATSGVFSLVLTLEDTGPRLVRAVRPLIDLLGGGGSAVMVVLIVACLILGFFVESLTLMIILGPILTEVATAYGVDPVHFGVTFVVAVLMGTVHPPLGYALMVGSRVGRVTQEAMIPHMFIFIGPMLVVLGFLIFIPELVTFIPDRVIED